MLHGSCHTSSLGDHRTGDEHCEHLGSDAASVERNKCKLAETTHEKAVKLRNDLILINPQLLNDVEHTVGVRVHTDRT